MHELKQVAATFYIHQRRAGTVLVRGVPQFVRQLNATAPEEFGLNKPGPGSPPSNNGADLRWHVPTLNANQD